MVSNITMRINLAYGKTELDIELPDGWDVTVIEPRFIPELLHLTKRSKRLYAHQLGLLP
jgi:hypothetical protein